MKYDSTDRTAFYAIMGITILTGVVCYFVCAAATPKPGVVDSIYRAELPPQTAASATANKTASVPSGPSVALAIPAGASTQGNPAYSPATLSIKKGDIVTVTNKDTAPHTVTSGSSATDPKNGKLFDSGLIMPGKSAKVNTASLAPGTYPFHCTVHTYMSGTLTVKA
jgi:plastocyanin